MHKVYWTLWNKPDSRDFESIDDAMKFCENLRLESKRPGGYNYSFISCASEIEDCTSLEGVAAPGVGYDWKKRR
jgi:hypothetical protein